MVPLFILLIASVSATEHAGVHVSIGEDLLTELQQTYLPGLLQKVNGLKLPDFSFASSELDIDFGFNFTDSILNEISVDEKNGILQFDPTNQAVNINLTNVTLLFNTAYSGQITLFGSESGNIKLSMENANIVISVGLGTNDQYQPTAEINSITIQLENSTVNIVSDDWLMKAINWFCNLLQVTNVDDWIIQEIAELAKSPINSLLSKFLSQNSYIATIDALGFDLGIDYHVFELEMKDNQGSQYLLASVNGTVFDAAHPSVKPDVAAPVPLPDFLTFDTVRAQAQSYVLDSALWAIQKNGILHYTLEPSVVPSSFPIKLSTTSFGLICPGLVTKYGYGKDIELNIHVDTAPSVSITNQLVSVDLAPSIDFMVDNNGAYERAFTLETGATLALNATISANTTDVFIAPYVDNSNSHFTRFAYSDSVIGAIELASIEGALNEAIYIAANIVNEYIREKGGVPIKLPSFLELDDFTLKYSNGFIEIDAEPIPEYKSAQPLVIKEKLATY